MVEMYDDLFKARIDEAAQTVNILDAALGYVKAGCSILPVNGKKPALISMNGTKTRFPWTGLQKRRPEAHMVESWYKRGWLRGIGLVCGDVSSNLVVIDLDGKAAVDEFKATWTNLFWDNYRVLSGSGVGMHVYMYVRDLPPSVRTTGFELRANGCYVVAPPSSHPDTGEPYRPATTMHVQKIDNLHQVVDWIKTKNHKARRQRETKTARPAIGGYGATALSGECRKIRNAPAGERNNQLNVSAFRLGQLIATGHLEQHSVEDALYDAALAVGLSEAETMRTIASGLNAGLRSPRTRQ